jgi:hypothetical protein
MGVNKNSKNIELSKEFVKWFVARYAKDSNMLSSIKGAALPSFLSGVEGITLVQGKVGTTKMATDFDAVQKESLISVYDGKWIKTIIEIGIGNGSQTFEQYMASLNTKWTKGIATLK